LVTCVTNMQRFNAHDNARPLTSETLSLVVKM